MKDLEKRLATIEDRNKRVEIDKKWETSLTRRLAVTVLTYFVVAFYLIIIDNAQPFTNALVPSIGYFLSTLLLRSVRIIWQDKKD